MSVIWSGITEEGAVVPVQVTEEGKVVAVGDGPQGDYLPITGGELTGDLEVDGSITAAGPNGSITAAGKVETTGPLVVDRDDGNKSVLVGRENGDETFEIKADGSATFVSSAGDAKIRLSADGSITAAGDVKIGGLSSAPNITLASDGSITAAGGKSVLYSNGSIVGAAGKFNVFDNGEVRVNTDKVILSPDGSITAAGGKCGFTSGGEIFFTSRNSRYKLLVQGELVVAEPYTREMEIKEKAEQFIADKRETKPSDPSADLQPGVTPGNDNA